MMCNWWKVSDLGLNYASLSQLCLVQFITVQGMRLSSWYGGISTGHASGVSN